MSAESRYETKLLSRAHSSAHVGFDLVLQVELVDLAGKEFAAIRLRWTRLPLVSSLSSTGSAAAIWTAEADGAIGLEDGAVRRRSGGLGCGTGRAEQRRRRQVARMVLSVDFQSKVNTRRKSLPQHCLGGNMRSANKAARRFASASISACPPDCRRVRCLESKAVGQDE